MKFTIEQKPFAAALAAALRAVPRKSTIPILENVLLEADGEQLTLTASDMETTLETCVPASVDAPGKMLLPASVLTELVRTVQAEKVTLESEDDSPSVTISWDSGSATLPTFSAKDYPDVLFQPKAGEETALSLPAQEFSRALALVGRFTADDLVAPQLNAVCMDVDGEQVHLVASDKHVLMLQTLSVPEIPEGTQHRFLFASEAVTLLKNSVGKDTETLSFTFDGKRGVIALPDIRIFTTCVPGKFPDWKRIMPADHEQSLETDRAALVASLRRVLVCSNVASRVLKFALGDTGSLAQGEVTGEDSGFGTSASEQIFGGWEGEPLTVAFNGAGLLRTLEPFPGEQIKILLSGPRRAVLIEPVPAGEETPENIRAIVMPVMIK